MSEQKYPVKRKQELELDITGLAFGGKGIARVEDYVIFVADSLPGDRVLARIIKRRSSHGEARKLEIISPSPLRITAPCRYFDWCGGCTWQNLEYDEQLKFKTGQVKDSLERLGGIKNPSVLPALPSQKNWAYRNKMEFSFSDRRWLLPEELGVDEIDRSYALGLHVPGTFDRILSVESCMLQSDTANGILQMVDSFCRENKLEPYGIRSHIGLLRFLVLRESEHYGEIMVNLVTSAEHDSLEILARQLVEAFPQVVSVVNNINSRKAQIAIGEREILLAGKSAIKDRLCGMDFTISAGSFFQTNTLQAERLYEITLEFAGLKGDEQVWDLYCGTGTISLLLAKRAKHVHGYELVESAVEDAVKNAEDHGVENVTFIGGDLLEKLRDAKSVPYLIVTDPPRSGMHQDVVDQLAKSGANRIVYVSCNPTTMARDIAGLSAEYELIKAQPVDMFPHTYHIETVCLLERKDA